MRTSSLAGLCTLLGLAAGIGIGHYAVAPGGSTTSQSSSPAAPPSRSENRTPRTAGGHSPGTGLELEDLAAMLHQGRSSIAEARLELALENQPAARLRELALQAKEAMLHDVGNQNDQQIKLQDSILKAWAAVARDEALAFVRQYPSRSNQQNAYSAVFATLGETDPERALRLAQELGDPGARASALSGACDALAERDPRLAYTLFGGLQEISPYHRFTLLNNLARVAPEEAAQAMLKIPQNERQSYWGEGGIFTVWASKNPEAVTAWAEKTTDLFLRNSAMKAVCAQMAADDPAAAMQRIDTMPPHLRGDLIESVMAIWADRDFKGALTAANALPQPTDRNKALSQVVGQISSMDSAAGLEITLQLPKGSARENALSNLASSLALKDAATQTTALEKFSGQERTTLAASLARSLISSDPQRALELFSAENLSRGTNYTASYFCSSLAERDPELAMTFATGLDAGSDRAQAIGDAIHQMAEVSPPDAAARLAKVTNPADRETALSYLASSWGRSDPTAALAWADTLSGEDRMTGVTQILTQQAESDPTDASSRLSALLKEPGGADDDHIRQAAYSMAGQWVANDPQAAAGWVATLPGGEISTSGASGLISTWCQSDAPAAATWLGSLPAGGMRDAGIQSLVSALSDSDPETAFSWSLNVSDPSQRSSTTRSALANWDQHDPAAAKAALDHARLSPQERAELEEMLK